ncbi:C39 family peptidase [Clostridium sp. JN-9]|uniref:C39 family peptidase n=1 Tax=Clostridium sp. JN-9 TaxID=2507159 RepID=UPI000FFE10C4|nr:C39 family peptidase [Clostridium sp. JN-9]QAT39770.1 hypothetical protein EQM05_05620 [Clostridium sp. JN-9]
MKRIKSLVLSVLASSILLTVTNSTAFAEQIILNPDGSKPCIVYPLDPTSKLIADQKQNLAKMHMDAKLGKISGSYVNSSEKNFQDKYGSKKRALTLNSSKPNTQLMSLSVQATSSYSWNSISSLLQQSQINSYYCGPATAVEILGSKGVYISQNTAASSLGTTTNGTDWYNGSIYPMQATLNSYENGYWYITYGTNIDASTFQNDVVYDIDNGYGVAGDAWEVPGGPHLVGHPTNRTIFHWFAIDGYSNYGSTTHYADSVYGASSISWSGNVPQYSNLASTTIAQIVNGRGIIW